MYKVKQVTLENVGAWRVEAVFTDEQDSDRHLILTFFEMSKSQATEVSKRLLRGAYIEEHVSAPA